MHVILITNYPPDRQESMRRFGELLSSGLREEGIDVTEWQPRALFLRGANRHAGWTKLLAYADKYLAFPLWLRRQRVPEGSIVHICDHANAVYGRHIRAAEYLVTCHDLFAIRRARGAVPGEKTPWTGRIQQRWIANALRRAPCIVAVSESTRQDLLVHGGRRDEASVSVVPNALDPFWNPMPDSEADPLVRRAGIPSGAEYILHVGNNNWYKNRTGAVRIYTRYRDEAARRGERPAELILAGAEPDAALAGAIGASGARDFIHTVSRPDDATIRALYSRATAFLFPSLTEGFGWPPLEAQACACPVVASRGGSLPEVLGDSALTADAGDEAALAAHLLRVVSDQAERARWVTAGKRNAARYSVADMVEGYCAVYDAMLSGGA